MKKYLKITLCTLLLLAALPVLSACNTMEGIGRDFKSAGEAITGSASNAKGY